jgi:hypothetical protein
MRRNTWIAPVAMLIVSILLVPVIVYFADHLFEFAFMSKMPKYNDQADVGTAIASLIQFPFIMLAVITAASLTTMFCVIIICIRQTQILNLHENEPDNDLPDDEAEFLEYYRDLSEEEQRKARKAVKKIIQSRE